MVNDVIKYIIFSLFIIEVIFLAYVVTKNLIVGFKLDNTVNERTRNKIKSDMKRLIKIAYISFFIFICLLFILAPFLG